MENGLEGAPQPYSHWYDHVFHMAHVTTECWTHYLYTCDREYLEKVAYPVMKECSKFFKELINTFKQMNYSEFRSEKFNNYLEQINKITSNSLHQRVLEYCSIITQFRP